jgi:hypothetical protein
MSFKELESKVLNCEDSDTVECAELTSELLRREEVRLNRNKKLVCPPGMVAFKDHFGEKCVSREGLQGWMLGKPY